MASFKLKNTLSASVAGVVLALAGTSPTAEAYPLSYYKSESILSKGHWVKISVEGEGIFQVSYDELRSWGFDDPTKVTVFGYSPLVDTGGTFTTTHVDDLPQTACLHTEDGRVLFYGESDAKLSPIHNESWLMTRNYYDRKGYYFLTDSQPQKKIETTAYKITSTSADYPTFYSHYSLNYYENEAQNPMKAGVYYHDKALSPGESREITFRIKDFDPSDRNNVKMDDAYFTYYFYMNSPQAEALESEVTGNVKVTYSQDGKCNSNTNANWRYSAIANGQKRFRKPDGSADALQDEDVTLKLTLPSGTKSTYAAIDRVYLCYPRKSRLGDERQLIMHYYAAKELQRVQVRDTPLDAVVWNVDNPFNITSYEVRRNDNIEEGRLTVSFPHYYSQQTKPCRMVVFSPSATHAAVSYCGDVANTNIHGTATPEMAIITTASLANEARALAAIHEKYQGIRVGVFVQDDVFNEFSSGARTPMAYRRMAKMFYDRESDVFKYLLLYGSGSWDNRGIVIEPEDRLLTFQVEIAEHARDLHRCYTSDQYFGMLQDTYNPAQIHYTESNITVGRLNLPTPQQAQSANSKIEAFMQNPPSPAEYLRMVVSSDQGDSNAHYQQGEEAAAELEKTMPGATVTRAHAVDYPITGGVSEAHTVIMDGFRRGQGFFGYSGHGGPTGVSGVGILGMAQTGRELYDTPVFAHFSSCDLFCFDRSSSLMDAMMSLSRGGIIGGVGASRSVYLEYNQPLYLAVCRHYANATPGMTYGEIFRKARNEVVTAPGASAASVTNTLCYNYLGDPAVPMPVPAYELVIETIDGNPYDASQKMSISPLSPIKIAGHIVRKDGKSGAGFSGSGLVEVYETPRKGNEMSVSNPDYKAGNGQPQTLKVRSKLDHQTLGEAPFEVEGGRFEAEIVLPDLVNYGDLNRMVLTATNPTTGDMAATTATNLYLAEPGEDFESSLNPEAPEILSMYIDRPDFGHGDLTGPAFTLYAVVRIPDSGLNMANNGLTTTGRLTLDVATSYSDIYNGAEYTDGGTVILSRKFEGLSDGRHTLKLSLQSNLGSTGEAELDFYVLSSDLKGELTCKDAGATEDETDGSAPVRTEASFDMTHNGESTPACRLLIFDSLGHTVFSADGVSFPYVWNLKDNSGAPVADGIYRAKAMLSSGNLFGSSEQVEFMVLK
ncbi:MAG: hypothetical protein K2M06_07125 [Muribaculaceae bacterium]|nr:hypothetical protein [Muribaculaceae bacterium]